MLFVHVVMASLLKQALKCLCGENRWSYAVFWKIGCQNPTLLVWEDYHYEPSRNSGIDSTDLLLKEWEGLLSYQGGQGEDRVSLLLNKMMINNHVHVVGEGIVGRVAFTDAHVWILQHNITGDQYPSEVLAEVYHQFSAGMQTVAAIPVLPHGVVQLGSTLTIMENMGFINDVKTLFAQLGGTPTVLSSDYYTKQNPNQNIATPPLVGIPISAEPSRNACSQAAKFTPYISSNHNPDTPVSQTSVFAAQPYSFITQNQAYMQHNALALRSSSLSSTIPKSIVDMHQLKPHPVIKTHLPLSTQHGSRTIGAQVILASSDARLRQQESLYQSSSRSNQMLVQPSSFNSFTFTEQQLAATLSSQEPVTDGPRPSVIINSSQVRSYGGRIPSSVKDSVIVSLLSGNQSHNTGNDLEMLTSVPYAATNSSSRHVEGTNATSSGKCVTEVSNPGDLLNNSHALKGLSNQSHLSSKLMKGKQVMGNNLLETPHMTVHQSDAHILRPGVIPDYLHEGSVNSLRHKESSNSRNVNSDNLCLEPSGDDLFDILGLDFKSKQLHGSWNNFMIHGEDIKTRNASVNAAACITETEAGHEVKDGISESEIFSGTGSDHLLDAVVSKIHSSAKQNSDDDMSCWTTLTRMSNSSVHTDSLRTGRICVPDQKQTKMSGFPSSLSKSQLSGSSSLRTGCSLDKAGESSQVNSIYGSQISLLCEDGSSVKRDSSLSTAHSKKPDETGKLNRKRLRPGENPRPRPKDRQMIQDRVKELREIVPNGAKCSIDALLERTIKHMLFLQSVTKHAENLKHSGESKIISKDGGLLLENNFDGGATWAFEVGSQSMVCPIIVEDLSTPRQMLVEMLCEEQGFFLEIADIIRGLGLTILKGVMEARNDKVWVRFTVEANRDVTRMEIFLSLVHLLEQAMKTGASVSQDPDNSNMMAQNSYHPAPVPVTGRSVSLQ